MVSFELKLRLVIAEADTFRYRLSEHPQAAVHAGWLTSTAFLIRDMMPRIDSLYRSGTRDLIMRRVFRKLTRPQERAGENYLSVLGERIGDEVVKTLPGFREPEYYPTFHYVRTGQTVVLHPDEEYAERFPEEPRNCSGVRDERSEGIGAGYHQGSAGKSEGPL